VKPDHPDRTNLTSRAEPDRVFSALGDRGKLNRVLLWSEGQGSELQVCPSDGQDDRDPNGRFPRLRRRGLALAPGPSIQIGKGRLNSANTHEYVNAPSPTLESPIS